MVNPWVEILLDDYENHMRLGSVMQLQTMNQMMKSQLEDYPVSSAMILGVAGGNGLEHVQKSKYAKVYGVDINPDYLQESVLRYPDLTGVLECLCIDLTKHMERLPETELLIANLLVEYIGYDNFQKVVQHTNPKYVSCAIQYNIDVEWVSDSPYIHVFDGLESVHQQIDASSIENLMKNIGYHPIKVLRYPLPNGKELIQMDYEKEGIQALEVHKTIRSITQRPFSILADCGKIYRFLLETYERDWRNGVLAPFFEYAYASFSYWMDISYSYKNRIWECDGEIVAFCFYENPVTDIYFCLKPGYEELAFEMVTYAHENMVTNEEDIRFVLFGGQDALMKAAQQLGYVQRSKHWEMQYDLKNELHYPLPEGFHFVNSWDLDITKVGECCWKGFDHEQSEGSWNHQYEQHNYLLNTAPHATPELDVVIADESGEYVCYAGMWWTPENHLAYMEPLCTIPEYRHKGLAASALSEMYRRTKALGATHMTGGANRFYQKIGYQNAVKWTFWKKQ